MGGFAIDYAHDSEEVVALKKHIANQDNKCAGLEDQLMKCGLKQKDTQSTLDETIYKLRREADSAVELRKELEKRNEELARERVMRQNLELSNQSSGQQLQSDASARKELQATLEAVAAREAEAKRALEDAARDKAAQDLRIRDLEANLGQLATATAPKRRGRASSLSGIHLASLERELAETRAAAARSEAAAAQAEKRASQARTDAVRIENEAAAMERRLRAEVQEARERATEQTEELEFLRAQQGAGAAREEELMQRIEMEETKVASMEKLLASSRDMSRLEDELAKTQKKLKAELARARGMEDRQTALAQERDQGLRQLEEARGRAERIAETLRSREADIASFEARERDFSARLERLSAENDALKDSNCSSSEKDAYVEKLLNSVTRIRGERDNLRRDLDFLQAESRFTIQGLEIKVAASSAQLEEVSSLRARVSELESRTDVRTPADEEILDRLRLVSTASMVVIARLGSLRDNAVDALSLAREELDHRQSAHDELLTSTHGTHEQQVADLHHTIEELQEHLDACSSELAESNIRRDELEAEVDQLQSQVKDLQSLSRSARSEQSEMHNDLEEKKRQLAEFTRALESTESERDTLSTQVMTLQHDLDQAREDIKRGDERYTALQAQQLSTLPSDGVASALRKQLEEYKDRVERRNEQIGKHQHEIQRLEATQRLQEDRLTELNDELDVAMTEKESMIEDCAEAREARDAAIQRVEELEEELESAELATQRLQDQHVLASSSLVGVWASAVSGRRTAATRFSAAMRNIQAQHATALRQLQVAEEQRSLTASVSDARASQLESALDDARTARAEAEQTAVALAVSQSSLRQIEQLLTTERDARSELDAQLTFVREELGTRAAEVGALQARLEDLRGEKLSLSSTSEAHLAQVEALRSRIAALEETIRGMQGREEIARQQLASAQDELRQSQGREASQADATRALESEIADLRQKHSTELEQTLARLETVTTNLESAQNERAAEAEARQAVADELTAEKAALELRVQEALVQLESTSQSSEDVEALKAEHVKEVERLQQEIAHTSGEVQEARAELEALHSSHTQQLSEVSEAKAGLETRIAELEASVKTSEEALDRADALHGEELAVATEKVTGLERNLQALQARLDEEENRHAAELQASQESQQRSARRFEEAQARLAELQDEMEVAQGSLQEAERELKSVSEQCAALEGRNATLQADVERSTSARHQAEGQVQASQRELTETRSELEQLRQELERSQSLLNNAQLQLDLQVTEHRRTLDGLHRQISQLKSRASEGGVVRELQEQLRDMDVLMSRKNEEIEGNDDRVMSLIKENKKLGDKVAKLTRKVETLQKKLAAAKETAAAAPPPPPSNPTVTPAPALPIASASSSVAAPAQSNGLAPAVQITSGSTWNPPVLAGSRSSARVSPPVPIASSSYVPPAHEPPADVPPAPRSRSRLSSSDGSTALTRPKTPERRFPTVFRRAKTPEPPRRSPPEDKQPTASTLGKRRADDIDDQVPAQGFTSEGTMDPRELVTFGESTPRARKSVRTGFTPVRNTTSRPAVTVGQRSPERRNLAPMHISDVTNSPRGSAAHVRATTEPAVAANKPGKWVNRLKSSTNSSGAPTARTVSTMRSFFEKGS
ncbi:hypothetical protein PENSPDRAFT_743332 [Peniophora sp. CONT]|nr:hypothetical protein PENSPDRAFT_743332 [Peniophora sp. CONT]